MNNDQNNINQPNIQPNLGNSMSFDNRINTQPMPATNPEPNPVTIPSNQPVVEPVPLQEEPVIQESVPVEDNNITGSPVKNDQPKKNGSGKLVIILVIIIILVIAIIGFFIGKSMIDSEVGTKNAVTDKTAKSSEPEEKFITYYGVNLITPNGYVSELSDDYGVLFKTSDKAYSMDFFEGTISDLDSTLLEAGAVSKGNKEIDGISFSLYSYTKSGKTELIYVTDTNTFRIMGFCVNSSFTYKENLVKDVVVSLGSNKEEITKFSPSEAVKSKLNFKSFKTIYEFKSEE